MSMLLYDLPTPPPNSAWHFYNDLEMALYWKQNEYNKTEVNAKIETKPASI
jgi:hypothetical protein